MADSSSSIDSDFTSNVNSDPTDISVGLSSAQLGKGRRRMLDLVNQLHATGVQIDIDLPQIAVIGNQSAGKSSLIEAISGITLPRASGTCTRCPTECRLSYAEAPALWKCVIFIRTITDKNGQPLGRARNEQFGDVILDKEDVEERIFFVEKRIKRAQYAILNPDVPWNQILSGEIDIESNENGLTFSSNYVSFADLSFCDLPGILSFCRLIRSTSDGSTNDIPLVEGLVESYIKRPSCIILLTVSCETDPQNQGALQLAKNFDPQAIERLLIGVLTKPDRISAGDDAGWIKFIKNEVHPLSNNWFCVKQPNSIELKDGITCFFATKSPWCELDTIYQRYLRTKNLVERLSSILSDLISKRLPQIHEELETNIQRIRTELQKLPKPPSTNPLSDISALIHSFGVDLSRHLEGTPDASGLLQSIRPATKQFRWEIRSTAPEFRPYEKRYARNRSLPKIGFLGYEEEEHNDDDDDEGEKEGEEEDEDDGGYTPGEHQGTGDRIYVDEVLRRALEQVFRYPFSLFLTNTFVDTRSARTRELPGNHPYIVQESFIREFTKQWEAPAQCLCDRVYRITLNYVMKRVEENFVGFGQGLLAQQTKLIVREHMKKCLEATEAGIRWQLALEQRPFTTNTHYLADYKDKFFSYYKGCRDKDINQEMVETLRVSSLNRHSPSSILNVTLSNLAQLGIAGVKGIDLIKLLPSDEMEPALNIMAEVRAYFQVAYKRFADAVPLAIDYELVRGIERDLLPTIYKNLHIHHAQDGQAVCEELARESPQIAGCREELNKKLERMQEASRALSCMA
ncbi:P-loop containing nucleoside triphosphate hydrolase protein [Rhodocollybia butyracea]|uniref:P-loop containing nucleoside triphosphate hydrolase protein n=1 Tax=Rhodocollybia butyracea TaxID=206335 RepID=A0A9P5QAJ3_9AGAR|nr:P-loop containing nucleoside triphosphate hydrolase protein [Rhodocollybia butyracea]